MTGKPLGHTQVQSTACYVHLVQDSFHNADARITESIGGSLMGKQGESTEHQ